MNTNSQSRKIDRFEEIRDGLEYLTGEPNVSLSDLMTDDFIGGSTDFATFAAMLDRAGVRSKVDLENPAFARFIKTHTRFDDWEDMLVQAGNRYARRHL